MKITGTNIKMTRGDSETITVSLQNEDENTIPFLEGDIVFFTIKENTNTQKIMLQKIISEFQDEQAIVEIIPRDTKEWRPKEYVYDIQLNRADGTVTTIIKPSKFVIGEDVTHD